MNQDNHLQTNYMQRITTYLNNTRVGEIIYENKRDLAILTGIIGLFTAGYFMEQQRPTSQKQDVHEMFGTPTLFQETSPNQQNYFWK